MSGAICVRDLWKRYGDRPVLKGISFTVERGEIFALLGVNGAGKTTALECLEGLRPYDGGTVTVTGRTGAQLQSAALPDYIRAMEAVELFARWRGTGPDRAALAALGIGGLGKTPYRRLSTGQKRRLHLALALTGDPDILFLDEPTAGLDVEGRLALHGLIRDLRDRGKTIVLASHDMAEVESLCDRLIILSGGTAAFLGTAGELTERVEKRRNVWVRTDKGEERFAVENVGEALLSLLEGYRAAGTAVLDVRVDRGTLEDHFMRIARGAER